MKRYFAVAAIMIATSCTSNTNQKVALSATADSTAATVADPATPASVKLKDANVQSIYNGYLTLKDALVNSKFEDAKKAAAELKVNLAAEKGCESTAVTAEKMATAKDIAAQRKDFTALSADLIALFKHAAVETGTIYVQHCPMANKGDGGDWLSSEKKIQNPYYGDEMMECGRVVEEIKAAK
ncbi:DUF3347 domain-containing protein [Pedobacter gandavensis]|uniref:DUF3347 domain-containing protein n=1 Tax=Pedobacter gandavensis TaxID=2679963 RepID=A0ABR6ESY8_9SPHI|nr:DUF3347 domain-containing protein [Pedobacter gandavensis]MBB2148373.1 DUF3347 domain-containing protein [Pedobacter gandavensis]